MYKKMVFLYIQIPHVSVCLKIHSETISRWGLPHCKPDGMRMRKWMGTMWLVVGWDMCLCSRMYDDVCGWITSIHYTKSYII